MLFNKATLHIDDFPYRSCQYHLSTNKTGELCSRNWQCMGRLNLFKALEELHVYKFKKWLSSTVHRSKHLLLLWLTCIAQTLTKIARYWTGGVSGWKRSHFIPRTRRVCSIFCNCLAGKTKLIWFVDACSISFVYGYWLCVGVRIPVTCSSFVWDKVCDRVVGPAAPRGAANRYGGSPKVSGGTDSFCVLCMFTAASTNLRVEAICYSCYCQS